MHKVAALIVFLIAPLSAYAVEYDCTVSKKIAQDRTYTSDDIAKWKYSVKIEDTGGWSYLSRCSYSTSARKVTCERYEVDKVEYDENVKIKKYYVFSSQFDVQLFTNLTFLENNGRGTIAWGQCEVTAP